MARRVIVVDDTDPRYWDPRYTSDRPFNEFESTNQLDEDDEYGPDDDEQAEDGNGGGWVDGGWRGFPAAKPRLPADGIRAVSQRGAIASTWWSRRFLAAIESTETSSRLTRGRSYARSGQVLSLTVAPGIVSSRVQGSRRQPYDVVLTIPVFRDVEWQRIVVALAAQAGHGAALLAGRMPEEIEETLARLGIALFPTARQLKMSCSCPDWGNPCKHAAAVCYLLAEKFDADPFSVLAWRGMAREPLLEEIRGHREQAAGEAVPPHAQDASGAHGTPGDSELSGFWDGGDIPQLPPAAADASADRLIGRLGPAGISVRGRDISELLLPAYEAMAQHRWE